MSGLETLLQAIEVRKWRSDEMDHGTGVSVVWSSHGMPFEFAKEGRKSITVVEKKMEE